MSEIDYSRIISRSFAITRKNKWLWVLGLAIGIFSASAGSGNFSSWQSNLKKLPAKLPQDLPAKTNQVLGEATNIVTDWFFTIPVSTWFIIGISLLIVVCTWIIVAMIIAAWAKGALIFGIDQTDQGLDASLRTCSLRGMAKIKHLIILGLISIAFTIGIILFSGLILLLGYLALNFSQILASLWLIVVVVATLTFVVFYIILAMLSIYAQRLIVLHDYSPWQAWKKGLSLSRDNFLATLIMGIINLVFGCSIGCLSSLVILSVLGLPAFILIAPVFKDGFHMPNFAVFIILFIILALYIYATYLLKAILTVFNFSNWTLFFKEIMKKEKVAVKGEKI